jgi:hypothetical protein
MPCGICIYFFHLWFESLGVDMHFYEVFESEPSHAPSEESNESHDSWSPTELTLCPCTIVVREDELI